MYAQQQPYGKQEPTIDRLPVYTRRGFATAVHVFFTLLCIGGIIAWIGFIALGSTIVVNIKLGRLASLWAALPTYLFVIFLVENVVAGATYVMAIVSPKFLHREQSAVIKSLLPMIAMQVLSRAMVVYFVGATALGGILFNILFIAGMLQGSKDNCLASTFVPFRKQ